MSVDPYKDIPSLDIEIGYEDKPKVKKTSVVLFILAILFICLGFLANLLLGAPKPPEYMSSDAKVAYLKGRLYGPIYLPFVMLILSQIFGCFRNNPARVKVLFWVSLFFLIGFLGRLLKNA